jgi:outer membrane receptor protein involved in Fe transport
MAAMSLSAQITGDLKGVVLDSSNSAVANAKVQLKSLETGEQRSAVTDTTGQFTFNLLKIGNYEVRAEAAGFRVASTQAQVRAGEIANVRFSLELGAVTETITVTDAVTQLDTENAQVQTAVTGAAIQDLPVNRNPNLFALTAPGVAPVSQNNPFLGSGSFNSNGGRGRGNNITVDGITATDVSVTGTGGVLGPLNFSAIKEVKVITNNFSAEYGRNSSSQVLYITKNGTNSLHGEMYDYFQNDKLNARPFFDTTGKANIVRQNQYGFEVGGPVYIPKVLDGRNKLFWHTTFEQVKQRGAGATRIAFVPTPAQAASITDPTAKALFDQYKVPSTASGRLETAAAARTDATQIGVRGDWVIGSRDTVWGRYSQFKSESASSGLTFIYTNLPGFGATSQNQPKQATAAHTHLFGTSAVNEFRFGFGRSVPSFPIDTPYPLGPSIQFQDGSVNAFGVWSGLPQGRGQNTYQFADNFSFLKSRHNIKVGGEYYYLKADSFFDANIRPIINFANWADFAAGRPASYSQRFGNSVRANRVKNIFAFVQDDWKVSRTLTVNLGLRLEWAGGPNEANGRISNLNLDNRQPHGIAGSGPFGLIETGKPSFNSNYNWGPRLGFAWTPGSGKTVIRGGYGITYDFVFLNPITNQRFLPPLMVTGALTGQASFTGNNSLARIVAGTAQIQAETAAQVGNLATNVLNFGNISPAIAFDLANAQVQQWNLGVQRETWSGIVVKAAYVGTKGNYLPRTRDLNLMATPVAPATSVADETARLGQFQAAFAGLSGGATRRSNRIDGRYNLIGYVESSANSNYHSGQFEVQKRWRSGFFITGNYTFAKSIDDGSDVLGVLINDSPNQQNPLDNRNNRAPSQFDLTHRGVIAHVWEPAWGKGSSSWFVRSILAGWGFSGITSFRSGFPVTLDAGVRRGINPLTNIGGGAQVRPNASGPVNFQPKPAGSAGSPAGTVNPDGVQAISAYAASIGLSQPLLGNFGTLGRNTFRLNGERNFDWNVYKIFSVTESVRVQVRAEFYNTFNNTSFQEVNRNIANTNFGQYTTVGQNARFIQLAARFIF